MTDQQKYSDNINKINVVIDKFFLNSPEIVQIRSKDLMPEFIAAGIFPKNHRDGLPIRDLLRTLDTNHQLHLIPSVFADRKLKNVNWYFQNSKLEHQGYTQTNILAQ